MAHAGGRPSKYKPEYCQAIIDYMGRGYSKTAFAGSIRVSRDAILDWSKTYPEFGRAVKDGEAARVAELERQIMAETLGPRVTARIFALKNACPDEWKESLDHKHSGDKKNPVKVESVIITGALQKGAETV